MTGYDDNLQLLFDIANCREVELLPKKLRDKVVAIRDAEEARVKEEERRERERAEAATEEVRRERERERELYLCLGQWGEKVPPKRRFALCYRTGKKFIGWSGQERDESKWADEPEYCAIDLVRGIMSPYWGYYGGGGESGQRDAFYNERVRPLLEAFEANDEVAVMRCIRGDWDFFEIKANEMKDKFHVLDYHTEAKNGISCYAKADENWEPDRVVIDGMSPLMTLAEHQEALKKEFCDE